MSRPSQPPPSHPSYRSPRQGAQAFASSSRQLNEADKLVAAVAAGDKASVMTILTFKPELIDMQDSNGNTPLTAAASTGRHEIAVYLLDNGANVDARDAQNWSALHVAAYNGQVEIIDLLLDRSADIEAVAQEGWTPLMWACASGSAVAAQRLAERGANIHAVSESGRDMLKAAEGQPKTEALVRAWLDKENAAKAQEQEKQSAADENRLSAIKSHRTRKNPFGRKGK